MYKKQRRNEVKMETVSIKRANGILLPISSLPSQYGIGAFDQEAYRFVNQLKEAGQKYWQILPLGPTGYGDSPYQSFSTFAGNPYLISLQEFIEQGVLTKEECDAIDFTGHPNYIEYEKLYRGRFPLLRRAFERSDVMKNQEFWKFVDEKKNWLEDYALFMAIKDLKNGIAFTEWEEEIRLRKPEALQKYREICKDDVLFYEFLQFEFSRQWSKLKTYANEQGIQIIGDIPIYVSADSADAWANPELFQFDENCIPIAVAGCPPDGFSATGQLWGNPLYDWSIHEETGFEWWIQRIQSCIGWYDLIRIDHFRGFDEYYSIPYGSPNAVGGHWEKGPGISIFSRLEERLGELNIIAEDLGFLTDTVRNLLKDTGFPGMKVLQFAFDTREESDYMPHNYDKNCVVYTGTHDNETTKGWFEHLPEQDKNVALKYMNVRDEISNEKLTWHLISLAMRSVATLCIIPMQDFLLLGDDARINTPSTLGDNWKWRMGKDDITAELAHQILEMTKIYGRF